MNKAAIKLSVQEQQENAKNMRKTLKILQQSAVDKENLVGRQTYGDKDAKLASNENEFRKTVEDKSTQTSNVIITADDLVSPEASDDYWRILAEKRGEALNDSLQENEQLKEALEVLKEENDACKSMLNDSKALVEVLQEMLSEPEGEGSDTNENPPSNV